MLEFLKLVHFKCRQDGSLAVIMAISMVVLISFTALAIDIGYCLLTKNELQNAADAASLAACNELGKIMSNKPYFYECSQEDIDQVKSEAQKVALKNKAAGENIQVLSSDIAVGRWDDENKTVLEDLTSPEAVQVIVRRDELANGPISTFFARIFGVETVDLSASATAALTALSSVPQGGGLAIPVGISKAWFKYNFSGPIKFHPTGSLEGCAGWHTFFQNANAKNLRDILDGLRLKTFETPPIIAGQTKLNFTGGTVASAFPNIEALYDEMRTLNDGYWDADEDSATWTTHVVVYNCEDCQNPNGSITIVGFATAIISEVQGAPEKTIEANVITDVVREGQGGNLVDFGTKGGSPCLVQ